MFPAFCIHISGSPHMYVQIPVLPHSCFRIPAFIFGLCLFPLCCRLLTREADDGKWPRQEIVSIGKRSSKETGVYIKRIQWKKKKRSQSPGSKRYSVHPCGCDLVRWEWDLADCQCKRCSRPGFDLSILRHSEILKAADTAVQDSIWKL